MGRNESRIQSPIGIQSGHTEMGKTRSSRRIDIRETASYQKVAIGVALQCYRCPECSRGSKGRIREDWLMEAGVIRAVGV